MNTRQQDILHLLEQQGEITIKTLSEKLHVTEMTIHRDLDFLEENHYLYKKRGAAVFINMPDRAANAFYRDEKRRIGKKAAEFIKSGQSILLDNSTTALECVKFLDSTPKLTFYTTNLESASIAARYDDCILYCSGGYYFGSSKGFIGRQAEEFVSALHVDICVIGASGISITQGITNPFPFHTVLQRKIIESAEFKMLLADHSKFEKTAMEKAADLSEIDLIITDNGIDESILNEYRKYVKIITV